MGCRREVPAGTVGGIVVIIGCLLTGIHMTGALGISPVLAQRADGLTRDRDLMVRNEVVGRGIRDPRVIEAMREVPRHEFVRSGQRKYAYADAAIPIGNRQTITSPFVVAFMTEKLEPKRSDKVLEIGTGSGYQAAVLSRLVGDVYTIEIVAPLGRRAAKTIQRLNYTNVHCKVGDGYQGWPEYAPFDKIIVTCSPENVPPALVEQLREGGRLVVPLGERFQQSLYLFRKVNGKLQKEKLEATFFVPMTGQAEQQRINTGDPGIPEVVNGSFEQLGRDDEVIGWFYVRHARIVQDNTTSAGQYVLLLTNDSPGLVSQLRQPISVDGRKVSSVEFSARVRTRAIRSRDEWSQPQVGLTFYDEKRAAISSVVLGPWRGDRGWSKESAKSPVPRRARFAVITVAMFGATGQFAVDDIKIQATPAKGSGG